MSSFLPRNKKRVSKKCSPFNICCALGFFQQDCFPPFFAKDAGVGNGCLVFHGAPWIGYIGETTGNPCVFTAHFVKPCAPSITKCQNMQRL